ncbi:MAG: hypothetical protein CBC29_07100 [Methylococcaceae bacterium TMED69]|nr:MAG: hypothetical protein CBC29_07100 [Methylococcaceae bacterium TMED69]|tara:strand:+ start:1371 stop:1733 length:363 start_codon:yes stop_codon:yes gene_type:complete
MTWAIWFKKSWEWCKINWKFILGISIPIIISILLRKGNAAKIYKKAAESRKEQLEALEKANSLEKEAKEKAQKEFLESVDDANKRHQKAVKEIDKQEKERMKEIDTADKATEAIKRKLEG